MSNICNFHPIVNLSIRDLNRRFKVIHDHLCYLSSQGGGGGGSVNGAENGTSLDGDIVVFGQDVGDSDNPAALTSAREIPLNSNYIQFTGAADSDDIQSRFLFYQDNSQLLLQLAGNSQETGVPKIQLVDHGGATIEFGTNGNTFYIRNETLGLPNGIVMYNDTGHLELGAVTGSDYGTDIAIQGNTAMLGKFDPGEEWPVLYMEQIYDTDNGGGNVEIMSVLSTINGDEEGGKLTGHKLTLTQNSPANLFGIDASLYSEAVDTEVYGMHISASVSGADSYGVYVNIDDSNTESNKETYGVWAQAQASGTGRVCGVRTFSNGNSGEVYGVRTFASSVSGQAVGTFLDVRSNDGDVYGIWVDISSLNGQGYAAYFQAGKVGVNQLPTARLHIGAGAENAGTAPLKIEPGPFNTEPEDNAIEYDGTNMTLVRNGSRQSFWISNDDAVAPSTTAAGTVTNRYGGPDNFLGDPVAWAFVVINGNEYRVPLYEGISSP